MTKEELEIAKAAYCVGKIWDTYEGKENFDHMVGLRVKHLIELVLNYQKPSLPSNLDEAAEEIASDIAPTHPDIGWDECFEKIKDGIKSGVEWMAVQGSSYEGVIYDDHEVLVGGYSIEFRDFFLPFKNCDEVIVQIRKKQ